MILQPYNLDGVPSIPKGQEFVLTAEQVAILERMFERHAIVAHRSIMSCNAEAGVRTEEQ